MIKRDLEFCDFIDIYEEEIYCAYMESGAYYDMDSEIFVEEEYEDYLAEVGQWASCPVEARNRLFEAFKETECENNS